MRSILIGTISLVVTAVCAVVVAPDLQAGDRELSMIERGAAAGGSEWFEECKTPRTCTDSGDVNNGVGCPTSYTVLVPGCYQQPVSFPASQPCVAACSQQGLTGGLCEGFEWDTCTDTTTTMSPGICGTATYGSCAYTCTRPLSGGSCVYTCTRNTNLSPCVAGGGPPPGASPNCGVMRTCK